MTIPEWDRNKVLPPIRPGTMEDEEHLPFGRSPYKATLSEFVERFAVSPHRNRLIRGLLEYREEIHKSGIQRGFQWVDGSFLVLNQIRIGRDRGDGVCVWRLGQ